MFGGRSASTHQSMVDRHTRGLLVEAAICYSCFPAPGDSSASHVPETSAFHGAPPA